MGGMAMLVICTFLSVFLTAWTAVSVHNQHGARPVVLLVDSVTITAVLCHLMGVW